MSSSVVRGTPKSKSKKLSRLHKPAEITLEQWQIELRRQFGSEQQFELRNLGRGIRRRDRARRDPLCVRVDNRR